MSSLSILALSEGPFGTKIKSADIAETLCFFDDWEDRYRYIIDLGKELTSLPTSCRTDQKSNLLFMAVDSEAQIVKGLAGIVLSAFNQKTPQQITDFDIDAFFTDIDLFSHLSSMRGNGLRAMVNKILYVAKNYS
jgi:cysteine desulfuration protein SufE